MTDNPFDAERHTCPICDGASLSHYKVDYRNVRIGRCDACGAQFMNPPYSDEYLARYYAEYNEAEEIDRWQETLTYCHDFYLSLIERFGRVGHLLDIGCGNGHLIRAALARGWTAEGFDVSDESTKRVADELGVTVHLGSFRDIDLPKNAFDLATMHHVLEHVKEPAAYIGKIHRLLRDDGLVFIASPNIRGLSHRLKNMFE
ncbi:MAG: methyltransferase domain-containing protein, partial [candidate division Zixibacteria bacterium]|nr:methyltransferase domain-containing protein [candidate division Zixibacteria bacterium]